MRSGLMAMAIAAVTGCAADVTPPVQRPAAPVASSEREAVVGRLKMRGRTIDLTVGSFAGERPGVPRNAVALPVMADIDHALQSGADSRQPKLRGER